MSIKRADGGGASRCRSGGGCGPAGGGGSGTQGGGGGGSRGRGPGGARGRGPGGAHGVPAVALRAAGGPEHPEAGWPERIGTGLLAPHREHPGRQRQLPGPRRGLRCSKSTPQLQARSELVFLEDQRAGQEGQTGHVVVRQGERVLDPSSGKSYEDMQAYLREQPQYREVGTMPGTTAAKVFSTEPGSPERARALASANVSPELQRMMVADQPPSVPTTCPTRPTPRTTTSPPTAPRSVRSR